MSKSMRLLFLLCVLLSSIVQGGCTVKQGNVLSPAQGDATFVRALEAYDGGDYAQSLEAFNAAIASGHADARMFNGRGVLMLRAGHFARAQTDFESAILLDTGSAAYRYNLALVYIAQNDLDRALRVLDEALRIGADFGPAHLAKGVLYLRKEDPRTAMVSLDRAVSLMPGDFEPLYNRAVARMENGLFAEAERDFSRCLELAPDNESALNNRGLARFEMNKFDAAAADFAAALALNAENPGYYLNRGIAFKSLWEYNEAVEDFSRAISYGPGYTEAYVGRGEVFILLGDDVAGCRDLRQACDLGNCESLSSYQRSGRCNTE